MAERLADTNLLCHGCELHAATHFCTCDIKQAVFCDNCTSDHLKQSFHMPHLILPIDYYDSAKSPEVRRKLISLAQGKEDVEGQVAKVKQWKGQFREETERFMRKFGAFQQQVEASFDNLHQALDVCVSEGIQEVKAKIMAPVGNYANPVARKLLNLQDNLRLLEWKPDFSQFKQMEKCLIDTKVGIKVECPGILEHFDDANIRLQREENKDADEGLEDSFGHGVETAYEPLKEKRLPQAKSAFSKIGKWGKIGLIFGVFSVLIVAFSLLISGKSCEFDTFSDQTEKNLVFPIAASREKLLYLAPYDGGNAATQLYLTGPRKVESGYYKGQWAVSSNTNSTRQEEHISGYGTMAYSSGDIYEGSWKQGERHGNGRLITSKGHVFEGVWIHGEFTYGICTFAHGTIQSGSWKAGKLHGFGQIKDGKAHFWGYFEYSKLQGLGLRYISENNITAGLWSKGLLEGPGFELGPDSVHWGSYEAGLLSGPGNSVESSGLRYTGQWKAGEKTGQGTETYPAESLVGSWVQGNRLGGVYSYTSVFRLNYEALSRNWSAVSPQFPDLPREEAWLLAVGPVDDYTSCYIGQVNSRGQRHGYGIQNITYGASYEGQWSNGTKHGKGCMRTTEGEIVEGMWEKDLFVWGNKQLADGTVQMGHWRNGLLQGFAYINDGNRLILGQFEAGKANGTSLEFTSATEFTVNTHQNSYSLHLSQNSIHWGYYSKGNLVEIAVFPTAMSIFRSISSPSYMKTDKSGKEVAAIAFKMDKSLDLVAVELGNCYEFGQVSVDNLTIFLGNATFGPVIYDHSQKETLEKTKTDTKSVKVALKQRIALEADQMYTLRVVYEADSTVYSWFGLNKDLEKFGIQFNFANAEYKNEDFGLIDQENSSPIYGFDFLLQN